MKSAHIAFILEQQYGHIMPTLGIALELLRRGHRVSYAVNTAFSALIGKIGAESFIINPLDTRADAIAAIFNENDSEKYKLDEEEFEKVVERFRSQNTLVSLRQLEYLYSDNRPHVVIHDDVSDIAGRTFATTAGIPKIRLLSQFLDEDEPAKLHENYSQDELILLTVPKFLQRNPASFDADPRFRFVGFIPEGRMEVFAPWTPRDGHFRPMLISATTGMLPQIDFCRIVIDALRDQPWDAVLSISGSLDITSALDPGCLTDIPKNIQLNRLSGNFEILHSCSLFIGQGGQGATLEAIFCGVPQIVIPPTPYHCCVARRISELKLGLYLPMSKLCKDSLIQQVASLLKDQEIFQKVSAASESMRTQLGAQSAADAIEAHLS